MTENQKRRMNDLLEANRQRELEPDEPVSAAATVLTDERIAELNREAQDQGVRGIAPSIYLARAIEAEIKAAQAVPSAPTVERDGWMVDGSLIYRLNDKGVNCDEINITMVNGSRAAGVRHDAAVELLAELTRNAPTIPSQVPAAEVRAQALEEAAVRVESFRREMCIPTLTEVAAAIRSLAQSSTADKASEVRAAEDPKAAQLRSAIEIVCEGWTLPSDARKVLETALWTEPSTADSGNTSALGEKGSEA